MSVKFNMEYDNVLMKKIIDKFNWIPTFQGRKYRYLEDNMWIPDETLQDMYLEGYVKMKKYDVRDFRLKTYKEVHRRLIELFFEGGYEGLELANFYSDNPNPLTEKKMKAIEGDDIIEHFVNAMSTMLKHSS